MPCYAIKVEVSIVVSVSTSQQFRWFRTYRFHFQFLLFTFPCNVTPSTWAWAWFGCIMNVLIESWSLSCMHLRWPWQLNLSNEYFGVRTLNQKENKAVLSDPMVLSHRLPELCRSIPVIHIYFLLVLSIWKWSNSEQYGVHSSESEKQEDSDRIR